MLSPYLVTTALVRFAAGELLVQMLLPLIMLFFYRVVWLQQPKAAWQLGAILGISWFTQLQPEHADGSGRLHDIRFRIRSPRQP